MTWKRSGGPKALEGDLTLRIDYKHEDGKIDFVEKIYQDYACSTFGQTILN